MKHPYIVRIASKVGSKPEYLGHVIHLNLGEAVVFRCTPDTQVIGTSEESPNSAVTGFEDAISWRGLEKYVKVLEVSYTTYTGSRLSGAKSPKAIADRICSTLIVRDNDIILDRDIEAVLSRTGDVGTVSAEHFLIPFDSGKGDELFQLRVTDMLPEWGF